MSLISAIFGHSDTANQQKLENHYEKLLVEDEKIEVGFKLVRDALMFTNKRMILVDKKGLTGKRADYKSITYNSISQFSVETAGWFDLEAMLRIWISGERNASITRELSSSVNIYELQRVMARYVLQFQSI